MPKEKIITATEAVRKFSELLNFVRYKGENYTVFRGGKPVASLRPLEAISETPLPKEFEAKSLGDLKELLKSLPKLGADAPDFERDVKRVLQFEPSLPKKSPWE
jgi:antitoxin (DNA-binding transcriptional repressor) of toxin-antitoxin stability system